MKRITLIIILVVSTLASWAQFFDAVAPSGQTLHYCISSDSTVEVWGHGGDIYGNLIIPSKVTHNDTIYTVSEIFQKAFYGCESLTSVIIPNSVKGVWSRAFGWCSSLTSVTIGNSVTYIGEAAFRGSSSLTKISIPNPNKKLYPNIASDAFSNCPSTIDSQLKTIFAAERSQIHKGFLGTGGTHTFTDNKGRKCKLYMSGYKARLTIGGTTYYGSYSGNDGRYIIRFDYDDSPYFTVNGQSSRKTTLYIRRGKIYLSETAADAENPKLGYQLYYREIDFE